MKPPDGIHKEHQAPTSHAIPISLLILAAVLVAAAFGVFGGDTTLHAAAGGSSLSVDLPRRIRNGEMFEMRIAFRSERSVDRLVLDVDPEIWRDMTVNSALPEAESESFEAGAYRFDYGSLRAGEPWLAKFNIQVTPRGHGDHRGRIVVRDGDRELAAVPVRIQVLP